MTNPENILGQGFHTHPERIGRKPKGARNRSTIIREWLETVLAEDGKPGNKADEIARALIRRASRGNVPAIKEALDSAYGKVPDKVVTAETEPEKLMQLSDEALKYIPTEVLEAELKRAEIQLQVTEKPVSISKECDKIEGISNQELPNE